jgi:hypothetical protein
MVVVLHSVNLASDLRVANGASCRLDIWGSEAEIHRLCVYYRKCAGTLVCASRRVAEVVVGIVSDEVRSTVVVVNIE